MLAKFLNAITATRHDAVVATEEVLSLVGGLLIRAGLTDDITVLRTPCVLIGQPAPVELDDEEIRRDRKERDERFLGYLVRQAITHWFEERGRRDLAEIYSRDAVRTEVPPKKRRKPRS